MAVITVEQLKSRFEKGDYPRETDYVDLIDTLYQTGGGGGSASITASDTAPVSPEASALWYNTAEAKAYVFYDNFWVELVPTSHGTDGINGINGIDGLDGRFITSATAPANPTNGDAWFDTESAKMFLYYDSYWIEVGPNIQGIPGAAGPQGVPGVAANYIQPNFLMGA